MVDCCNSDQVQSSYFAMTSAFKDFIFAAHEVFYNISQVISDLDFKEFKVCHRNIGDREEGQNFIFCQSPSDWTEVVTTTLLAAHVIFLILFLCSRSIIHSFKE